MFNLSNQTLLRRGSYVNGVWAEADQQFKVFNPANKKQLALLDEVSVIQIENAINAADKAFASWSSAGFAERANKLMAWRELLLQNQQDLAQMLTLEQGKPMAEAMGEVIHAANYLATYAEQVSLFEVTAVATQQPTQQAQVYRRAIGVVSAVTPWNFPCSMVIRKVAAALMAGCTFVLKPSELTPLTALALAQLSQQAGIDDGVFNVVVGSNAQAIGEILTQHPKVAKFSFTGSTIVGKRLLQQCAVGVKRTSMELGGNAPFMVFEDADLDAAIEGTFSCKFRNSGQTCVSANRFLLHESIAEAFKEKLIQKMRQLIVGDGQHPSTSIGPLINQAAINKINRLISESVEQGARIIFEGNKSNQDGYYFVPTVVENITPSMPLFQREIFGPVVAIMTFKDDEQAVALANQTELGLCGYLYSKNQQRNQSIAAKIQVGMLGINQGRLSNTHSPFGGVKQSGMGREGGRYGVEEYLDYQFVCRDLD